jgi:hypothetical protein
MGRCEEVSNIQSLARILLYEIDEGSLVMSQPMPSLLNDFTGILVLNEMISMVNDVLDKVPNRLEMISMVEIPNRREDEDMQPTPACNNDMMRNRSKR